MPARAAAREGGVVPGRKAGEWVYVEPVFKLSTGGARLGLFAWKFCRHSKGRWAGQRVAFEPFQLSVLSDLMKVERDRYLPLTQKDLKNALERPDLFWQKVEAWLKKQPARSTLRVHSEALIGWPKKNGKSTMTSALALYLLIADDEPGAEVYSAASAKDQAKIVFASAKAMVEASPWLDDRLEIYRNEIVCEDLGAVYKVVSADAKVQEGINPSGVIFDELHAHGSRDLYDTMTTATVAREQPLFVSITTAGYDLETICGEVFTEGAGNRPKIDRLGRVVPSKSKRRRLFFHWRTLPKGKKLEDRRSWKLANPASWLTVERLEEERARRRPAAIFYRYHLNVWTAVEKFWLPVGAWDAARGKPKPKLEVGDPAILFVDVGLWYDTSALVAVRPPLDADRRPLLWDDVQDMDDEERAALAAEKIFAKAHVWGVRREDPNEPDPDCHDLLDEGPIRLTTITTMIRDLAKGLRILAVGADPYKFESELQALEDEGFVVVRFDQSNSNMIPASEGLYRVILEQGLEHDGDRVFAAHVDAAAARDAGRGSFRLSKKDAANPMDAAVALAGGVSLARTEEIVKPPRPTLTVLA